MGEVCRVVVQSGACEEVRRRAAGHTERGLKSLAAVPANAFKRGAAPPPGGPWGRAPAVAVFIAAIVVNIGIAVGTLLPWVVSSVLNQSAMTFSLECPVRSIPTEIRMSVTAMVIGEARFMRDQPLPEGAVLVPEALEAYDELIGCTGEHAVVAGDEVDEQPYG